MNILIGADPEFFLKDTETKKYVSAHGLIPGDKKNPHKLEDGACQLDGTAIEFNINPAGSGLEFSYNVHSVLKQIREMIPKQYAFEFKPAIKYDKATWDKIPASSKELGCDPDFNANSGSNVPQSPPQPIGTMRTGAGHLHIGWTNKADPNDEVHFWDCRTVIRDFATLYQNLRTIWDQDYERANMYGNGPIFRPKPYGVEFRTPSNAWLNFPNLWDWMFELSQAVFMSVNAPAAKTSRFYMDRYSYATPEKQRGYYNTWAKSNKFPLIPDNWNEKIAI